LNMEADECERLLLRAVKAIPKKDAHKVIKLEVLSALPIGQLNKKAEFQHPNQKAKTQDNWTEAMIIELNLEVFRSVQDLKDVISMKSNLPQETDMTLFFKPDKETDKIAILNDDNFVAWTSHKRSKADRDKFVPKVWVKNVRINPSQIKGFREAAVLREGKPEADPPVLEDSGREEMMKKTAGLRQVVLDWEDWVHKKCDEPVKGNVKLGQGESLVFEFVASNQNQQNNYKVQAWSFFKGIEGAGVVEERLEKVVKKGPAPDYSLRWRFIANGQEVEDKVLVQIDWEKDEELLELTKAPYANETCVQFYIDVSCLAEQSKAGQYPDVWWHGLYWDGVQSKPTKPK